MKTSTYEQQIINILKKEKIKFEREKMLEFTRKKFRYDFFLPELQIFIEVDGQYHFQPIRGTGALKRQQENDRKKNSLILSQNLTLYRIPYWELSQIQTFDDICCEKF